MGVPEDPGVIPRFAEDLFKRIESFTRQNTPSLNVRLCERAIEVNHFIVLCSFLSLSCIFTFVISTIIVCLMVDDEKEVVHVGQPFPNFSNLVPIRHQSLLLRDLQRKNLRSPSSAHPR